MAQAGFGYRDARISSAPDTHVVRAISLMLTASLLFSIMAGLVKVAAPTVPFMQMVFCRAAISLLLLAPPMLAKNISLTGQDLRVIALRGLSGFISVSFYFYALGHILFAEVSALTQTSVIFVAILSAAFLGERAKRIVLVSTLVGLLGAGLILKPGIGVMTMGGLAALFSGIFSAVSHTSVRQLRHTESALTIVFNFSAYALVLSVVLFGHSFIPIEGSTWLPLIGIGVLGAISQVLMTSAYRYAPAPIVSPYNFSGVIFAVVLGAIFWSEIPDMLSIIGACLVTVAGIVILRASYPIVTHASKWR